MQNRYDDELDRRSFKAMLRSNVTCDNESSDESGNETLPPQTTNAIEETFNIRSDNYDRGRHIVGVIHMKTSKKLESKKLIPFLTSKQDVYNHIYHQLASVIPRVCCPSWLKAFVDHRLEIDWERMHFIAIADNFTAALRLKIVKAALLLPDTRFHERKGTYTPICEGRPQSSTTLQCHWQAALSSTMLRRRIVNEA